MKYKYILFDFDGTLVDSGPGITNGVRYAFEQLGRPVPPIERLRGFVGPPLHTSFSNNGIEEEMIPEAIRLYRSNYNYGDGKYMCSVYPGIPELLQKLKEAGYKLYVATSKPEGLAKELLEYQHLDSYFDYVAGTTLDLSRESKADVLRYLLSQYADLDATVLIGDTFYDVEGANELNLPCIGVSWGYGSKESMKEAGAIKIVDNTEELMKAITENLSPIAYYTWMYPQLSLPIAEGESKTEEYAEIVRYGELKDEYEFPVQETGLEERIPMSTPAGQTEVLYLPDRDIFERIFRALAYKCEPREIPRSTGAALISGINNWRKIRAHEKEFLKDHKAEEWMDEFKKFTSNHANFRDVVLLVSRGNYSNVPPEQVGYEQEEWYQISKEIRIYHELTHFISRKLYIEHKEAVRDEVLADSIGIIGALGHFDAQLERIVLGIEGERYREGGRLQNYVKPEELDQAFAYAKELIDKLEKFYGDCQGKEAFEWLLAVEDAYVK